MILPPIALCHGDKHLGTQRNWGLGRERKIRDTKSRTQPCIAKEKTKEGHSLGRLKRQIELPMAWTHKHKERDEQYWSRLEKRGKSVENFIF